MKRLLFSFLALASCVLAQENVNGNRFFLGKLDASQASLTSPIRVVSSLPGTCDATRKEIIMLSTNSTAYICSSTNTWTSVLNASLLGAPNGIAPLDANSLVPKANVPNLSNLNGLLNLSQISIQGTPTTSTFLRGDGTWATPSGTSGTGSYTLPPATASVLGGVTVPASSGLTVNATGALSVNFGTSAGSAAAGNDSRFGQAVYINGVKVNGTPADGNVLTYVAANSDYEPKVPTGGTSGNTSSTSPVYFNSTINTDGTFTVGTDCTAASTPCKFRVGNISTSFNGPYKIVPASGAQGTVLVYFEQGNITVGGTAPMNSSTSTPGLVFPTGVTNYPSDSIPLYTCTVGTVSNAGQFDPNGCTDYRSIYNTKNVSAGTGIVDTENPTNGTSNISIDATLVGLRVITPPATSSASCSVNQWSFDSNYYYLCTAANTWKRIALGTF